MGFFLFATIAKGDKCDVRSRELVGPQATERLVLTPAIRKDNTTGYKNVTDLSSEKRFAAQVRDGGKSVFLGYFDTAEEAATAYARSEYGRADAAKLLQPRNIPTPAGAEAIRQAEREGLSLATSSSSNSGYKGVTFYPKERGSKKYKLAVTVGGKDTHLGLFVTAEQAALFFARREAGRDTGSDLTAPPPPPPPPEPSSAAGAEAVRQAEREGLTLATSSSSNSGYTGVCYLRKRRAKKYLLQVMARGKQVSLGVFATAEEAALARARHLWDTAARLLEPQPQQAPPQGAAGPSEASSVEEDGFDPADIADAVPLSLLSDPLPSASEHRAARRQARAAGRAAAAEAAAGACANRGGGGGGGGEGGWEGGVEEMCIDEHGAAAAAAATADIAPLPATASSPASSDGSAIGAEGDVASGGAEAQAADAIGQQLPEVSGEEMEDEVEAEAEVEVEQDEPEAPEMSDDDVEEVAPPLPRLGAVASSFAGGDVQISAASGASKPICP